jgi:hypothetical protein
MTKITKEHLAKMQAGRSRSASIAKSVIVARQSDSKAENDLPPELIGNPQARRRYLEMPMSYRKTYLRAIRGKSLAAAARAFCQMCSGWENCPENIRGCTDKACPLYHYRPYAK